MDSNHNMSRIECSKLNEILQMNLIEHVLIRGDFNGGSSKKAENFELVQMRGSSEYFLLPK